MASGLMEAYKNLITSQHRGKPNYMATLTALLKYSEDIFACTVYMDDYFDLDIAGGEQEDVLGVIVGAERNLPFQPDHADSSILNDEMYRVLLKAKIAKNAWRGGIEDLQDIWYTLFGQRLEIIDNQDMTMDVNVAGFSVGSENDEAIKEMIQHGLIIPKPQSVRLSFYMHMDDVLLRIYTGIVQFRMGKQTLEISKPEGADINLYSGVSLIVFGKATISGISPPEPAEIKFYTGGRMVSSGKISIPCVDPEDEGIPRFPLDFTSPLPVFVGLAQVGKTKIEISQPEGVDILLNHGIINVQTGARKIRSNSQPDTAVIDCKSGVAMVRCGRITILQLIQ